MIRRALRQFAAGVTDSLTSSYSGNPPIENVDYANSRPLQQEVRTYKEAVPRITDEEKELVYRYNGLIRKGVNRRARDAIRKGFLIEPDDRKRDTSIGLNNKMKVWLRDTKYYSKTIKAVREMYVIGDGYLEFAFNDDTPSDQPPKDNVPPTAVYNVDPMTIRPIKDENGEVVAYFSGDERTRHGVSDAVIEAYLERGEKPRDYNVVHPKRIQHFQVDSLRDDDTGLGISAIDAAYINAVSKLAGDLSAGDVLEWYAKGFHYVTIEHAAPGELDDAKKQLDAAKRARKNHFVGSERHDFDIKSPIVANIRPFYDAFYIELAAALELPLMILLGVQKGSVTGSEVDLLEYYDDIAAFQELLLESTVLDIARRVLGRDDFSIEWVPLFVNEQTEADIRFKDSQSASILFNAQVLTRRQSIQFIRDGTLPVPDDVEEAYSEKGEAPEPDGGDSSDGGDGDDGDEPDEAGPDAENADPYGTLPLTRRDLLLIERERRLGESIIDEGGA